MNYILKRIAKILSVKDPQLLDINKGAKIEVKDLGPEERNFVIITYGDEIIIKEKSVRNTHMRMLFDLKQRKNFDANKPIGFAEAYNNISLIIPSYDGLVKNPQDDSILANILKTKFDKVFVYTNTKSLQNCDVLECLAKCIR